MAEETQTTEALTKLTRQMIAACMGFARYKEKWELKAYLRALVHAGLITEEELISLEEYFLIEAQSLKSLLECWQGEPIKESDSQ